MKKLVLAAIALAVLAPSLGMLSVGLLFSTTSLACAPSTAADGDLPGSLSSGSAGAWGDPVNGAEASVLSRAGCAGAEDLPPGPDGVCPPSGSSAERGLKPNALRALRCVKQRFPWITYMGGVGSRPSGYVSDHPAGRAVDFMIPAWNTTAGNARGWEVAHWLQTHAEELHVKYLIFDDRSWRAYNPSAGWRPYRYPGPNPSGASQRHLNHVHLSVSD